ncbi:hypothetical protein TrCOL_g56 [Triparma columacea]|uniref:Cyclic nucleotide-binding domain-containing protein n=1 Tax=Triparma columacea TaxID=722753 RepID=A0A9W7L2D8_9STRA|nr:hypothetical protein TrCOL_g56 [Triparma columacea]
MSSGPPATLPTPLKLSDKLGDITLQDGDKGPSIDIAHDDGPPARGMARAMADDTANAFAHSISPKDSMDGKGNTHKARISYAMADQMRHKGEKAKEKFATRSQNFIHPKNKTKIRWDMYCGALIIYSVCLIPWRIGFEVEAEGLILYFDYCVDICFAFDMLFCFFTAYYEEEMLVVELSDIRVTYLKSWFIPDLLSTVPVDKVAEKIIGGQDNAELGAAAEVNSTLPFLQGAEGGGSGNELAGFRLIRILRLARLLKLMRLLKLSKKGSNVDMNEFINPAIRKLLIVLGKIMFIAHLLSCIWFGVNACEPLAKIQAAAASPYADPSDASDWVMCGNDSLISQYISSFYWTIATMMAVGYGDVSPGSTGERIFGIMTQVVGAMSFGLIIATVGIIVDTLNPEATLRKRRMDTLTAFMEERGITKGLKRQVKDHFEYFFTYKTIFNEETILHELPPTLKAQLVFELRKSDLKCIKFLKDLDLIFVTELVVKLKPMCMQYMQTLGCTGSFNAEAYFITKGKVQGLYPVGLDKMTICGLFKEGDDFEMDTMLTDMVMRCSYRAISVTDLLWMECEDFNELAEEYPACGENVRVYALHHKKMIEEAIASKTEDYPEIGMAQTKVLYESNLCMFKDVLASFEIESDLNVSKIRTYRAVMVGENTSKLSSEDLSKMAKEQKKTPPRSKSKGLAAWASSSKIAPKDLKDGSEDNESSSNDAKTKSTSPNGNAKQVSPNLSPKPSPKLPHKLTPKLKQRAMTTGGMGNRPDDFFKADDDAESNEAVTQDAARNKTIQIIRRKDSNATKGQMMSLDTPLALFAKHGTFIKTKKVVQVQVEETTAELAKRYIINPKDGRKISWDLFIGALIIWSVIIVPFRLGFDQEPEPGSVQEYVDIFQDIMFGIDIILCFRVAFLDDQLVYVTEPRSIAMTYFRSWFLIDFLSTFPIDRIIIAAQDSDVSGEALMMNSTLAGDGTDSGSAARSLKMIKVLRLIRLSKLARLFKLKNLVKGMDEILALSAVAMKALQLVTTLLFIGHLFGCFWSYISANITEMITDDPNRWWHSPVLADVSEDDVGGLYVSSLYWAFTTMTTVGYGDVLPTNDVEKVYATLIMVLGATIFGYIVGSVGALAVNVNGAPARRHAKVSMAMNYLAENQLPKYHSVNVKKQILFYLQCKSPFNEDGSLLSFLPREMRREIILQSHKSLIPHIPLFKRQSRDFISFLLTKMRPQMVTAGQTILDSNMGSDGIYFLLNGTARMSIIDKEKEEKVTSVFIEAGRFFGHEIYIEDQLTNDESLYRLYNSVKDCELFVLLDIDISHLLESWPCIAKQLKVALHQMIRSQPPIKFNTVKARKQRKSMQNFSFGTKKEGEEKSAARDKAALHNMLARLSKVAEKSPHEKGGGVAKKKSVSFKILTED